MRWHKHDLAPQWPSLCILFVWRGNLSCATSWDLSIWEQGRWEARGQGLDHVSLTCGRAQGSPPHPVFSGKWNLILLQLEEAQPPFPGIMIV